MTTMDQGTSIPIIDRLHKLAENLQPVKLINTYRGIPITYNAIVIEAERGTATLGINEYQAVCLVLEGKTHLQSPHLSEVFRATPVSVDVLTKKTILTEFVGVGRSLGNRLYTRVQPKGPIDVELRLGEHHIPGQLADISLNGIGVFTLETYTYGDLLIKKNTHAYIAFDLPPEGTPVWLEGTVATVLSLPNTTQYRLGLKILPDPEVESVLLEYVASRRDALMREISAIYDSMRQEAMKKG
jgi:hypothetical protein